ncbi:hypothetical protein C3999_02047 [Escherichia marmotae]|nr:hypothetical protein C4A10_02042 [Escherichia marmotae]RDR56689.1 hypothetical protein C4A06_01247 [Escherichia marmotae]RDR87212.1 hypothetical protein C3999_02047 [Escherichia marmotae]RDR92237.1 hypothetical protein C3998_02020 [Escherichia marmotae]
MAIKKLDDGRYEVDIRPTGRNGKRIRRKFDKKSEAVAFEKYTLYNHHNKEWLSKPTDKRRLSELTQIWWDLKGKHEEHGKSNLGKIEIFTKITNDHAHFKSRNPLSASTAPPEEVRVLNLRVSIVI